MLKNIPNILSPELLKILMEMGHGDELVIADGNFPATNMAERLVRLDGHGVVDVLEAVLKLFPLDTYDDNPIHLMEVVSGDKTVPTIWNEYEEIIKKSGESFNSFGFLERFRFYNRAKEAFAVIATSESELYANIILRKGVVVND
jgi:L-fucose mutarotase